MFRSYDHHQAEKYITTLGLLNWQRIRCFISDDDRTTETCSYVYLSNITHDSDVT
jgi:hypothetical protein